MSQRIFQDDTVYRCPTCKHDRFELIGREESMFVSTCEVPKRKLICTNCGQVCLVPEVTKKPKEAKDGQG